MTCCGKTDADVNNVNTGNLGGLASSDKIKRIVRI